ncbi:MAG: D-alanyl-D-alanine carboxypeptidase [Ktedonobacteraceae bacterium]|nr:D-alanyl-D-alanine carboxypeptidase [Ktedonobacteraceae bacterium]
MSRRLLSIILLLLSLFLVVFASLLAFTAQGSQLLVTTGLLAPTPTPSPTPIPSTPTPIPTPSPVLTPRDPLPALSARAAYLVDMDTGNVLLDRNGEQTLPMASTTKIMTALIALQTADLDQEITVKQDAIDRVGTIGSNAGLVVGEKIRLRDLLYGLMVPSGDDAAVAIADALAGSQENFVARMNLFAYRLRLFHTHYANVDGLTPDYQSNPQHYTTAADLTRLAAYAMQNPLFARIVQTKVYTLPQTAQHGAHTWYTTNDLLSSYNGLTGIKTGHTWEAGYCLVFSAERNGHHLIGALLNSPSVAGRNKDTTALLDWAFALPTLPPYA